MRSSGLVLMGVATLVVVGYAFYTLLAPTPPRSGASRSRAEAGARAANEEPGGDHEDEDAERTPRARERAAVRNQPASRRVALPVEPPAAVPRGAAPRPTPEIPLDEARKQLADYMAELEGIETSGMQLTSPEWVEHYKRGHEVLLPLQQHLDWQVPEEAEELRVASEGIRAQLSLLDPGRQPPPPSPPP